MFSRFIHIVACARISFLLKADNILLYMYTTFYFIHSFLHRHLGCFHLLAIVNNAVWARVSNIPSRPCFPSFGYTPRRGIAGSYGYSMFQFLRHHHIVFHSSCIVLHSHQQLSASLPTLPFAFSFLKNNSHHNGCEVASHCGSPTFYGEVRPRETLRRVLPIAEAVRPWAHASGPLSQPPYSVLYSFCYILVPSRGGRWGEGV